MSAPRAASAAVIERPTILKQSMRAPFASLLSQTYGKPVQLNLRQLDQAHLNPSILAAVAAEKMRERKNNPRNVHRELVHKVTLPQQQDVLNSADYERIAVRALRRRPSLHSVGTQRTSIRSILGELNLKRVSSIMMRIGGRYGKRLTADQADYKLARKGLTGKGAGFLIRNVRPAHTAYATRAGKRKVGAFGVKVWLGHA